MENADMKLKAALHLEGASRDIADFLRVQRRGEDSAVNFDKALSGARKSLNLLESLYQAPPEVFRGL